MARYQILYLVICTCYSGFIFYHGEIIRILGKSRLLNHLFVVQINLSSNSLCIFHMIDYGGLEVISSFNRNIGNT